MLFSGNDILRETYNNFGNVKKIARGFFSQWILTSPAYKNV